MAGYTFKQKRSSIPLKLRFMRWGIQTLSVVSPYLAGGVGYRMFRGPRNRLLRQNEIFMIAERQTVNLDGDELVCYLWGDAGRPIALLVHGWESAAEHMVPLIQPLLEAGYRVIAYDGPAHGHSDGTQADPLRFGAATSLVAATFGPIDAVIAHSLGGAGVMIALENNPIFDETQHVVLIGVPDRLFDTVIQFAGLVGLSDAAFKQMTKRMEKRTDRPMNAYEISRIAQNIRQAGLIIHDKKDGQSLVENGYAIHANWEGSQLYITSGYGHRRILKKEDVHTAITQFLTQKPVVMAKSG